MKNREFTSGLTIENILNMDVANLTTDQLRAVTTRLGSAANKRLKRMEKAGIETSATKSIKRSGGKISVKGKSSRKDVRAEYNRAKKFLTSKSSSVSSVKRKGKGTKKASYKTQMQKDVNTFSNKELRDLTSRMGSAVNRRIKRMLEEGETSPAMIGFFRAADFEGGDIDMEDFEKYKIKLRGLSFNQVRSEYKRAKDFLTSGTSDLKSWRKVKSDTMSALKERGIDISDDQWDLFWKSYEKLKELDKSVVDDNFRYRVLTEISAEVAPNKDASDIAINIKNRINKIYEDQEGLSSDNNGVSRFIKPQ